MKAMIEMRGLKYAGAMDCTDFVLDVISSTESERRGLLSYVDVSRFQLLHTSAS